MLAVLFFTFQATAAFNDRYIGVVNSTLGERCPKNILEKAARATKQKCIPVKKYHCLFDTYGDLVEACFNYKQLPAGNYPYFNTYATGNPIDYDRCPSDRYQTWPAKSYEINECAAVKSTCSGEGQIECSPGTYETDRTCKCDHTNGYAMVENDCCSPSATLDCSCYKRSCGPGMKLTADYSCVACSSNNCLDEHISTLRNDSEQSTTTPYHRIEYTRVYNPHVKNIFIAVAVFAGVCFLGISLYIYWNQLYTYKWKQLFGILFGFIVIFSIGCFLFYQFYNHTFVEKYGGTVIIIFTTIGCVYVIYLSIFYDIQKERAVYNEDYEIAIFNLLNAAKMGDIKALQSIADENYINMNEVNYDQRSALHLAVCEGQVQTVEFLLKNEYCNIETTDRWNTKALVNAFELKEKDPTKTAACEKIISLFIEEEKRNRRKKNKESFRETKASEIIVAAKNGEVAVLKRLLKQGADMDLSNQAGRTALHVASENGITKVVDFLIEECEVSPFVRWAQKRPIDCVPDDGNDVNDAIREKLMKYMESMLAFRATNPEETLEDKNVMVVRLLNCAARGDIKRMKIFKESGYDLSLSDYDDRTALHIAVSENQEHIVDFLLKDNPTLQAAVTETKDRWNVTPLKSAKDLNTTDIYNIILKHCKELIDTETDEHRTFLLLTAGAKGDIPTLKELQKKKVDMDLRDYDGRTALHLAAAEGQFEAVKFLVNEAKVSVSIIDRESRYAADECSKTSEIRTFLDKAREQEESNLQFKKVSESEKLMVSVMTAASKGILHTLTDMTYQRFTMDNSDYFKETPLHVAAAKARMDDVKYLLDKRHVSPFMRNSFWKTPLQLVEKKIKFWKQKEVVASEIKLQDQSDNAQENIKRRKEDFLLIKRELKRAMDNVSDTDIGVEEDQNFKKRNKNERIFLFLNKAYKGDIISIRRYLLTDRTLLNSVNYDKRSALHIAAAEGHRHLVQFLICQRDVDVNIQDRWSATPLREAMRINDREMIKMLETRSKMENNPEMTYMYQHNKNKQKK